MKKYNITYNNNHYHYNGNDTAEVMEKFANRKVFGRPIICNFFLKMFDAETQGERWAYYEADGKLVDISFCTYHN